MSIRVTITDVKGSAPREVGAVLEVFPDRQAGSIGGGALEFEAIRIARQMLSDGTGRKVRQFPLGPSLGQCCGGSVTLKFELDQQLNMQTQPLWIWGAGHVGQALTQVIAPLSGYELTVIDSRPEWLTGTEAANPVLAQDPLRMVPSAPASALHLVLTHDHTMDLDLCDALLRHGFAQLGLIGSQTKWARFRKRLAALGHTSDEIARIQCPIGAKTLGKEPGAIAVGVAAALLSHGRLSEPPGESD